MDTLKDRVEYLLKLRGISQAEAGRRGNFKNNAFISDIMIGKKLSVRGENLLRLAAALSTTTDFLLMESENPDTIDLGRSVGSAPNAQPGADRASASQRAITEARKEYVEVTSAPFLDPGAFPRDIPVRGIVVGGEDGDFTFNGDNVDYVRRPLGLSGKKDIYALRVEGESMLPVYRYGALIYVDPNRRPGVGEDAVIELHPINPATGDPGPGYIKRVKRILGSGLIVEQFNPPKDITFDRADIKATHRVIPWEEVLGI